MLGDVSPDLMIAAIAAECPWLPEFADLDRTEFLREIAALVKQRAQLRAEFYRSIGEPSELTSVLADAQRATARLAGQLADAGQLARLLDGSDEEFAKAVIALPSARRGAGIQMLVGAQWQSQQLAKIAEAAAALNGLIGEYRGQTEVAGPNIRAEVLRQEFVRQAAEAWKLLTGKRAGKSKDGPFLRFASALWLAAEMPHLGEDPREKLGTTFQRLK